MSAPASRRGFLRGLTTLPLIGGGVTLIGSPSAVAEPVTDALRLHYLGWLAREFTEALVEREVVGVERHVRDLLASGQSVRSGYVEGVRDFKRNGLQYLTDKTCGYTCPPVPLTPPSTRAALVLSAVGADWR